jgi:hypothetical protein
MRSALTFSLQFGHFTRASGSALLVSTAAPHAGQVCRVDAFDSVAIGAIVTIVNFQSNQAHPAISSLSFRAESRNLLLFLTETSKDVFPRPRDST